MTYSLHYTPVRLRFPIAHRSSSIILENSSILFKQYLYTSIFYLSDYNIKCDTCQIFNTKAILTYEISQKNHTIYMMKKEDSQK